MTVAATTFLDYARRGRNAWWRYLLGLTVALVVVVLLAVMAGLALGVATAMGLVPAGVAEHLQDTGQPRIFFTVIGLSFLMMLAGVAVAVALVHRKHLGDVLGQWRWNAFAAAFVLWLLAVAGMTLVDYLLRPGDFTRQVAPPDPGLILLVTAALAVQTFAEEYVFRGYLTQGLLLATKNTWLTAVLSGAIFGACHIPNGIPQAVFATAFGIALALIAIRSGGLAFGYGMHLANNLFGALIVVSSGDIFRDTPGLFRQAGAVQSPLDGVLAAVALAAFSLWFIRRKPAA